MTLTMPAAITPARHHLLNELDAATHASTDAHLATRALTDILLASRHLPAEIYHQAPYLSYTLAAVTAASRTLTTVTGYATADPSPERLHALRQATDVLTAATADLRVQTSALITAASWYTRPAALSPTTNAPGELQL